MDEQQSSGQSNTGCDGRTNRGQFIRSKPIEIPVPKSIVNESQLYPALHQHWYKKTPSDSSNTRGSAYRK